MNGSRIVYTYDPSTKKLSYYLSGAGGYSRKAHISVPQSAIDIQETGADFSISQPFDGPGGVTFDGSRWQGGLDNLLLSKYTWTDEQLDELFALEGEDFPSLSFYHQICTWCKFGEDTSQCWT